jgi:hypothetical protein
LKAPLRRKAEGLRAVRRFGDDLSDLRASAYAFDGTRCTTTGPPTARVFCGDLVADAPASR